MDELIERLAEALKQEFPFLNGPNTAEGAFEKAAAGIVKKMGLSHVTLVHTGGLKSDPVTWEAFMLSEKED